MAEPVVDEPIVEPEPAPVVEPEVPEPAQDDPAPEPDAADDPEPEGDLEPERVPSRRESLRIQQLLEKLKEKDTPAAPRQPDGSLNYKTALDTDDDTVKVLDDDRRKYGEGLYNQGLEQAKIIQFQTRLEIDAPRIEAKYPVLDKDSSDFNPVVANALNQMYLSAVGWDPTTRRVTNANVRYADYIEGLMELSDEVASKKVAQSTKNIAKQASVTGLRPSGGTGKRLNLNQVPGTMSDDELKAVIAQAIPSR